MNSQTKTKFFNNQVWKVLRALVFSSLCLLGFSQLAIAANITNNPEALIENTFRIGPAKLEMSVEPGLSKTMSLIIENRTGTKQHFEISFEDFVGASDPDETVTLLGDQKSETSLKDFIFTEEKSFELEHGDRLTLPVTVTVPSDISPGGYFGAVIVSASKSIDRISEPTRTYTGATVIGRIASLIFVRVTGEVVEDGTLENLKTKNGKRLIFGSAIPLRLEYRNNGNVSLNPYGEITIKNIFGTQVARKGLDPWFALPNSIRTRDVSFEGEFFGRYVVKAAVNRGYGDIVDEKAVTVYVIPPVKGVLTVLALILIGLWFKRKIKGRKEIV